MSKQNFCQKNRYVSELIHIYAPIITNSIHLNQKLNNIEYTMELTYVTEKDMVKP